MRTDLLLAQFDTLVRTPEDVAGLEAAILDLAVRGQLVPQDPGDEPATELLARIKAERKRLVREGKLRKPKRLPLVDRAEWPYQLPESWVYARLGDVFQLEYGKGLPKKKRDDQGDVPVYGSNGIVGYHSEALVDSASIVVGRKGSSGAVNLALHSCWVIDTAFFVTLPVGVDLVFAFYLLKSLKLETLGKGIKPGLNRNEAYRLIVALPPLAVQKSIVARVDELLAQTRALAAELDAADDALVPAAQASFQALTDAPDGAAQREAWQRIDAVFDALTADPRTLDALKQTILQLAVQGKLVPQDPDDEPAGALAERIKTEKKRLIALGKARRRKALPSLQPDEVPYQLPEGWEWIRLDEVADIASGTTKGRNLSKHETVMLPYLRVANVQRGYLDLSEIKEIEIKAEEKDKYLLETGDLLLTEGGDADKLGRSAIWNGQVPDCIHQNHIFRARMHLAELGAEWVMLCTNSRYGRQYFLDSAKQTTNLASINMTQLRHFPVVLPPLAEQKRIVAKVESLLALCETLAAEVVTAEEVRGRLLAAVLNGGSDAVTFQEA